MTALGEPEPASIDDRGTSLRRVTRLVGIVGLVFSALFIVSSVILLTVPGARASDREIQSYYTSDAATLPLVVGLYLMPFSGIAFIWFVVALRMWVEAAVGTRRAILQSNVQLVAGIAFVILTFIAGAASSVVAGAAQIEGAIEDVDAARQFPIFGRAVVLFFAVKMAAMFVFTTSLLGQHPEGFPDWFAYGGFVVGLFLLLTPVFSPALVLTFPIWVIVLCWIIFRAARRIPKEVRVGDVASPGRLGTFADRARPGAPGSDPRGPKQGA